MHVYLVWQTIFLHKNVKLCQTSWFKMIFSLKLFIICNIFIWKSMHFLPILRRQCHKCVYVCVCVLFDCLVFANIVGLLTLLFVYSICNSHVILMWFFFYSTHTKMLIKVYQKSIKWSYVRSSHQWNAYDSDPCMQVRRTELIFSQDVACRYHLNGCDRI